VNDFPKIIVRIDALRESIYEHGHNGANFKSLCDITQATLVIELDAAERSHIRSLIEFIGYQEKFVDVF
jgi:hypothetical protein